MLPQWKTSEGFIVDKGRGDCTKNMLKTVLVSLHGLEMSFEYLKWKITLEEIKEQEEQC